MVEKTDDGAGTTTIRLVFILVELALLVLIIYRLDVESRAFFQLMLLVLAGFPLNHFLPERFRLPFFLFLSLAGIVLVLTPAIGIQLILIGLILIGLCHIPVPMWSRILLVVSTAIFLALGRIEIINFNISNAVWPLLGSMFMFRLIVYLYDLKHDRSSRSMWRTLSYFFLLPNVCFPLFPIVDYRAFRRTYYDQDAGHIYQRGVEWIIRGIIQLLIYRFIYNYLPVSEQQVTNSGELFRSLFSGFLFYMQVSGQFHIITGVLHLFGFNLARTNNLYFLASSYSDFWRRGNIYWKDFMMKIFYYPIIFKLKKQPQKRAMVMATLSVFIISWILHSFQWFWLRGTFPVTWQDFIFWTTFGVLVMINSLHELKHPRRTGTGIRELTIKTALIQIGKVSGVFLSISTLWSIWTANSMKSWLGNISAIRDFDADARALALFLVMLVIMVGGPLLFRGTWIGMTRPQTKKFNLKRSFLRSFGTIAILLIVSMPLLHNHLGDDIVDVLVAAPEAKLNKRNATMLRQGYYEDLVRVERFNSDLWKLYMKMPPTWKRLIETDAVRHRKDFLRYELLPDVDLMFRDQKMSTNRWGMRDREYQKQKPPGTYRIALLGASNTMGWGVGDGDNFETFMEEELNRSRKPPAINNYEILNFAAGGYSPLQLLWILENKVFEFEPEALFFMAHKNDDSMILAQLRICAFEEIEIPYELPRKIVQESGITPETSVPVAVRLLKPHKDVLVPWLYQEIARVCRAHNIQFFWVYLPDIFETKQKETFPGYVKLVEKAGFTVIDLSSIYDGLHRESYSVAEFDDHPNVKGQQLIATHFLTHLRQTAPALFRPITDPEVP